jgi:hypothetical protein
MIASSKFHRAKSSILIISSILVMTCGLTACDQLRTKVAGLIAPQSAKDELLDVNGLIDSAKFKEAFEKASARVNGQDKTLRGEFAYAAAKASAYQSDSSQAIRYVAIAVQTLDLSPDEVLQDIAFENMRTNMQFLQAITDIKDTPKSQNESSVIINSGDTGIKMNNSSTEVRAGDVVIKMSK